MQVEFKTNITNEWIAFSEIVGTVSESTTYYIQSRGADMILALESDSLPENETDAGTTILPHVQAIYKKDTQDLYLRAFSGNCAVNVTAVTGE